MISTLEKIKTLLIQLLMFAFAYEWMNNWKYFDNNNKGFYLSMLSLVASYNLNRKRIDV